MVSDHGDHPNVGLAVHGLDPNDDPIGVDADGFEGLTKFETDLPGVDSEHDPKMAPSGSRVRGGRHPQHNRTTAPVGVPGVEERGQKWIFQICSNTEKSLLSENLILTAGEASLILQVRDYLQSVMLTIAFILAVLVQLTKAADLLLRPHQQRWVQSTAETITLWLSDLDPLSWYSEKVSSRVVAVADLLMLTLWAIDLAFLEGKVLPKSMPPSVLPISNAAHLAFILGLAILGVVAIRVGLNKIVRRWLYADHRFGRFVLRFALLLVGYLAIVLVGLGCVAPFASKVYSHGRVPFDALMLLCLPFACLGGLAQVQVLTGIVILFLRFSIFGTKLVVLALQAFMWRVVEHNKGAWAAVTFTIAVVIGLVEIFAKKAALRVP